MFPVRTVESGSGSGGGVQPLDGTDHLTHTVLIPGILAGQRFRRVEGPWPSGKHDYLTIWEMDDPAFALAQLAQARRTDTMPISGLRLDYPGVGKSAPFSPAPEPARRSQTSPVPHDNPDVRLERG